MAEQSQKQSFEAWQSEFADIMLKIRQAIEENEWDCLSVILEHRQRRLETFCRQFTSEPVAQDVSVWLKQLMDDDQEIVAQIQRQQQAIRQTLFDLDKGRKAISAYQI